MTIFPKIVGFLKEVKLEASKVSWPSARETIRNTFIVIGFSVGVAIILGAFDFLFTQILEKFIL